MDTKLKVTIYIFTIISIVSGFGTGFYHTFAKEKAFQTFKNEYEQDKKERDKKALREIIYECKLRYGADYSKSPDDFTMEFCIDAEIDLENLMDE